jgi:RNA polymerase sigma factor (sigma-70 family)
MTLIQRWNESKDPEAFTEIIHRYAGLVYGACLRVLRNADDAEDVAQECFMRLGKAPVQVTTSFAGWLHTMATRRAINRLRSNTRRNARERDYAVTQPTTSDAAWDDVQHLIDEAVAGLPDKLRIPLVEHYLLGRTMESIGEEIGVTRQAVSRRVQKGVDKIRVELRSKGVPVSPAVLAGGFMEFGKASPSAELLKGLLNSAVGGIDAGTLEQVAATKTSAAVFSSLAIAVVAALVAVGAYSLWFAGPSSQPLPPPTSADEILPVALQTDVETNSLDTAEEEAIQPVTAPVEKQNVQLVSVVEEEPKRRGLSGIVVLKDTEEPIAGVEVELLEPLKGWGYPLAAKFVTGPDGTFEFPEVDLKSGFILRLGWPYRYKEEPFTRTLPADWTKDYYILEAHEHGAVTGYVQFPDGTPASGAGILRSVPFMDGNSYGMATSDDNGRFGFAHDGGTWRLTASGTMGIESESVVLGLRQGDTVEQVFVLPHSAAIHLTVTKPDGNPPDFIRETTVHHMEDDRRLHTSFGPHPRNDVFTLPLLPAGAYTITVKVNGFESAVIGPIVIPESLKDQYVSVTLDPKTEEVKPENYPAAMARQPQSEEPSTVKVSVRIQDGFGYPLETLGTFMYSLDEWGNPSESSGAGELHPESSRFSPGTYWLFAVREGYPADIQLVHISEQSNAIMFTLGEGGTIYGTVLQASKKKLAVLPLEIWELIGKPSGIGQIDRSRRGIGTALAQGAQADEDGSFALPYLPEGWYVVMSDSAVSAPVEVRAGHETGPIHLAPATLPAADGSQSISIQNVTLD